MKKILVRKSPQYIGNKFKINLLIIPVFYAAYRFNYFNLLMLSYASALIHELFHIIFITAFNYKLSSIIIQPFGITARINENGFYNSAKEIIIVLAGPFSNILIFILTYCLNTFFPSEVFSFLMKINISMFLFNLTPALPLDGGRALRALLSRSFGVIKAYNFMLNLSKIIITAVLLSAIFIIIFFPFNFSLILICVFLLFNLCNEQACITQIILEDILKTKNSITQKKVFKTKKISVYEKTPAKIILKLLNFDYFLSIDVLNNEGKYLFTVSECETVDLLIKKGIRANFTEFNKK